MLRSTIQYVLSVYLILFQQKILTVRYEGVGRKLQSKKCEMERETMIWEKLYFLSNSKTGRSMRMD